MNKCSDEYGDDVPQLSAETFSALQEFYKEQEQKEQVVKELNGSLNNCGDINAIKNVPEDWQLSQFWYADDTAFDLANEVERLGKIVGGNASIACVSCPTLYIAIKKHFPLTKCKGKNLEVF